jgi:hypothetical protein
MYCKNCGYILDFLPEPRCPECGLEFDPEKRGVGRKDWSSVFQDVFAFSPLLAVIASVMLPSLRPSRGIGEESAGILSSIGLVWGVIAVIRGPAVVHRAFGLIGILLNAFVLYAVLFELFRY